MHKQLIIPEVYNNAISRLIKSELLADTLLDLINEYENILSPTIVTQYKCKSINKILNQACCNYMNEDYLLYQLKISKRMYNKTVVKK